MKIIVKDNSASGEIQNTFSLETNKDTISVCELIKLRIFDEVERFNKLQPEYFRSLIKPTDAEISLNRFKLTKRKMVDPEKQYYHALEAFQKNGYFIIVNGKQAESLDEKLTVNNEMEVKFIKLIPLVGG